MPTSATRRTHIVRVTAANNPEIYIDWEVLDAVAFRNANGKELVLTLDPTKVIPNIVDNTGDGNAKPNPKGTRRSHMKRITSTSDATQFFDFEIIDAIAFRDQNGEQWILNNPDKGSLDKYNTTTGQGDPKSTRRVHFEKVYSDPSDTTSPYMLVERCDTMSFRNINGKEMIIVMPSADDGTAKRASSITTPANYDPTNTAVTPPNNTDAEIYGFIPSGASGVCTGTKGDNTTAVTCGPLWWPRAINKKAGPWYWYIPTQTASTYSTKYEPGQFVWLGNPTTSSWGGKSATFSLVYMPGILTENLQGTQFFFHPFSPFGFPSLDSAILNGQPGDWGLVDFSDTRIDTDAFDNLNKNPCVPGVSGTPDIWQLTGIPAPPLIKPTPPDVKWLPGPISTELAKKVATTWGNLWNDTTIAFNTAKATDAGDLEPIFTYITWPFPTDNGGTQRFLAGVQARNFNYPTTSFDVPLYDFTVTPPLTGGRYIGGLPLDFWGDGTGKIDGSASAYAESIGVAQLDPTKWNTNDPNNPQPR